MRAVALGVVGCLVGLAGGAEALAGCDAVLGIDAASLEPAGVDSGADAGGDDGGADAGAADGGADTGAPAELSCASYCDTIMKNCTGTNTEYLSAAICLSMCPTFDLSATIADTADDTLGCRIFEARAAATTPEVSCRFAGPLGGGHCGSTPCLPFCTLDVSYCAPPLPVAYEGGLPECTTECKTLPYNVVDAGDTTSETSNSLNCRLWHLETAFTSSDYGKMHCEHTGLVSATCTQ
jgi:hypothetical protein